MGDPAPCTPAQLARRGLNVVLISRSLSKLEQEAKEIGESQGLPGPGRAGGQRGQCAGCGQLRAWPARLPLARAAAWPADSSHPG